MDKVLNHHLYEYKKGLRRLILHTIPKPEIGDAIKRFETHKIPYIVNSAGRNNCNIYFGDQICIDIIKQIDKEKLSDYTPEEDFILGTMLGYCRQQQCKRFLKLKNIETRKTAIFATEKRQVKLVLSEK